MTKKNLYVCGVVAFSFLLAGPAAFARTGTKDNNTQNTTKKDTTTRMLSDTEFVKEAAEGGLAEVKFGQLAEEKGGSQTVKDFGKRMVTDHSKANDDLKAMATKEKITLPTEISAKDQAVYNRLSKLSGDAFDRIYARDMVRDHIADIGVFKHEAKLGKDTSVKDFASQTLPTLEEHLKLAHEMHHTASGANPSATKKSAGS